MEGKTIESLDKLLSVCVPDQNVDRAIALVPFICVFDPWLEYLGYIRDK